MPVATAVAAARALGVTRLADITGLDRIGLPVWQAVRPWGRSISVHQGKGIDADAARLGACMEAIECSHAENWQAPTLRAAFSDLPASERAASPDDFAVRRGDTDEAALLAWTIARRLDGGVLWVPEAAVSLDLTRSGEAGVTRSSNGQGAGFAFEFAAVKALCEVIERDAMAAWQAQPIFARSNDEIDRQTIDFSWFQRLQQRCAGLGVSIRVYRVPAAIAIPVFAAELHDASAEAAAYPHTAGSCAHLDAEAALRGAVFEAIQSRLTIIAGAREDLPLGRPTALRPVFGLALARAGDPPPLRWHAAPLLGWHAAPPMALDAIASALVAAGYPQAATVTLSPAQSPVVTVKAFVPGLGETRRARRAAA